MPDIYSVRYMKNHCIDVFFRYNHYPFHVLTYGCLLPTALNNLPLNRKFQKQVAIQQQKIEGISEIKPEETYLNYMRSQIPDSDESFRNETIASWFLPIAEVGFYTYDCVLTDQSLSIFKLVAKPQKQLGLINDLPLFEDFEILNYVPGTQIPDVFAWNYQS